MGFLLNFGLGLTDQKTESLNGVIWVRKNKSIGSGSAQACDAPLGGMIRRLTSRSTVRLHCPGRCNDFGFPITPIHAVTIDLSAGKDRFHEDRRRFVHKGLPFGWNVCCFP